MIEPIDVKKIIIELGTKKSTVDFDSEILKISPGGGWGTYEIELNRIKTHEDCVKWINHLNGKVWFTKDVLSDFIVAFEKITGLKTVGI